MSKQIRVVVLLFVVGAVAYVIASSMGAPKVSCEVCVEFKGREECRTARGPTPEEAIQTARDNACALIVSGRTESILCGGSQPKSFTCDGE